MSCFSLCSFPIRIPVRSPSSVSLALVFKAHSLYKRCPQAYLRHDWHPEKNPQQWSMAQLGDFNSVEASWAAPFWTWTSTCYSLQMASGRTKWLHTKALEKQGDCNRVGKWCLIHLSLSAERSKLPWPPGNPNAALTDESWTRSPAKLAKNWDGKTRSVVWRSFQNLQRRPWGGCPPVLSMSFRSVS